MNFETWEPVYEVVLAEFGYLRADDEAARDELRALVEPFHLDRLGVLDGATVAVAGGADSLSDDEELEVARSADVVIAASTAADVLVDGDVTVDLVTTDLDKRPGTAVALSEAGVPVAVHAHGDNRPAVRRWVPRFDAEQVLATTQAAPAPPVFNFGGFTDSDRGAFLADHYGAAQLRFPGWDFDDPSVGAEKGRKLQWAARLLGWLERRRGERFPVLDGRRASLDLSFLDGER